MGEIAASQRASMSSHGTGRSAAAPTEHATPPEPWSLRESAAGYAALSAFAAVPGGVAGAVVGMIADPLVERRALARGAGWHQARAAAATVGLSSTAVGMLLPAAVLGTLFAYGAATGKLDDWARD